MTKQSIRQAASPAILEAQAQLLAIRAKRQTRVPAVGIPDVARLALDGTGVIVQENVAKQHASGIDVKAIGELPDHLGWQNEGAAKHIKAALQQSRNNRAPKVSEKTWLKELARLASPTPDEEPDALRKIDAPRNQYREDAALSTVASGTVKHYPDIGLGILRAKLAAPGRIWLLLRWIDKDGSGQIAIDKARRLLCEPGSALQVCGWRQMRSLLARGNGIFWLRDKDRLWLRSVAKVGQSLAVDRLAGHPVALPIRVLLAGIGQVRAHLYASFHSGRKQANPISRTTLQKISQVSVRSQQNYEKQACVRKQKNYAIGSKLQDENAKNSAWRFGSACFRWNDHQKIFKSQSAVRLAWQLPNSYHGPHARRPRGQQRSLNRELADLSTKGMTGNGHLDEDKRSKRYFKTATAAMRHMDQANGNLYWNDGIGGQWYVLDPRVEIWASMSPEETCRPNKG